jgi:peptidoglycan/LPS O-acetylase OafA/YrhL
MTNKKNHYFYSLDIFRGFCGYGVAITHLYAFAYNFEYIEYLSLIFAEFFFTLSGFVLYPQLLKVIKNKKNLFIFYKRRWMRTLPLYLITLILISALTNNLFSFDFFKYFFLIQKIIPNFLSNDYYPVIWHLSIEESFYLIFPLIVINFSSTNFINKVIFIFISITIIKFFSSYLVDANFYRTGTIFRFDAILLGFIIAHFKDSLMLHKKTIFLLTLLLSSIYLFNSHFFLEGRDTGHFRFLFIIFMQFMCAAVLMAFILMEPILTHDYTKKFSLLISQQAYSLYTTHMIFIYLLKKSDLSIFAGTSVYLISLFFLSTIIYKYFEEPIMKLRPKII